MEGIEPQHVVAMNQEGTGRGFDGQFAQRRWLGICRPKPIEYTQGPGGILEAVGGGGKLLAIALVLGSFRLAEAVFVPDGLVGAGGDRPRGNSMEIADGIRPDGGGRHQREEQDKGY